jgi:crossover junction endodeoxyribonuclease RuvC
MMHRILGIDPGSRTTGYGVIEVVGSEFRYIESGALRIRGDTLPERLHAIFDSVSEVLDRCQPTDFAIENLFMHRNADSALKLGQARGAAICSVANRDIKIFEYTPAEIKQSVVGKGNAAKPQVQMMVRAMLKLKGSPQADEADALACAICHGNHAGGIARLGGVVKGSRGGRWR